MADGVTVEILLLGPEILVLVEVVKEAVVVGKMVVVGKSVVNDSVVISATTCSGCMSAVAAVQQQEPINRSSSIGKDNRHVIVFEDR